MKKAINNGAIYFIAAIVTQLINLFLIPLYTQNLSVNDVGQYNIITSIQSLLAMGITLGIYSGMIRFFNEVKDKNALKNLTITFSVFWSIIILIIIYFTNGILGKVLIGSGENSGKYVICISIISVFDCLLCIYTSYYSMEFKAIKVSVINISNILIRFIISYVFIVKYNYGILGLLYAQLLGTCMVVIILIICDSKNYRFIIDIKMLKKLLKYGLGLLPGQISAWVLTLIDRYFLKGMTGFEAVAIYSMAYKVGMLINPVFINPFTSMFTPVKFAVYKEVDGEKQIRSYFYVYNFLGWFCILGLSLIAKISINILATKEYLIGANLVIIIAFSYFLWGLGQFYSLGLHIKNKMLLNSAIVAVGAIFNVIANFIFIPFIGMYGAAIATCISYVIANALYYRYSNKYYKIKIKFLEPYKLGILVCLLYCIYIKLNSLNDSIFIEVLLIGALLCMYIFISIKMNFIPKDIVKTMFIKIKNKFYIISNQYKIEIKKMNLHEQNNNFKLLDLNDETLLQMYLNNDTEISNEKYKILESRIEKNVNKDNRIDSYIIVNEENEICGYCHIAYDPIWVNECNSQINKLSREVYLFDDYVFNKHRGNKIQKFSIKARINLLVDKGYKFATVLVLEDNMISRKSYESLGFKKYRRFMVIKLFKFKKTFVKRYYR